MSHVDKNDGRAGMEMLLIGSGAAAIAYGVGVFVAQFVSGPAG